MKTAALTVLMSLSPLLSLVTSAATNLVSNTAVVTNRVQGIVTYTMSNGVARVQDPSGKLVGTAEERALKVAAEGQVDIASAAADAAGTAMEEWREFTATTDVKVVYIDAGFTQDLPALAPNLCGWVAGSFYDREKGEDHYYIWFNREIDYPPSMCARIVSESGTNWLDGAWVDWAVTNWIDKATGRGWTRPYGAEVEYLESHQTEYIDTGVLASGNLEFSMDVKGKSNTTFFLWGSSRWNYAFSYYNSTFRYTPPSYCHSISINLVDVTHRTVVSAGFDDKSKSYAFIGTTELPIVADSNSGDGNIMIFRGGNGTQFGDIYCFGFQMKDSGALVRDLIPVLDLSGRPAMYDRVSGAFFYNQGTGEFAYGPVLNPVPCRELVVPRRNANCVLKTGTVITLGGKDGFDADIHKVNIEIGGEPTVTTSAQLPLFYAVTRSGTNRVTRAYTNGFVNVENGFVKEPSNE